MRILSAIILSTILFSPALAEEKANYKDIPVKPGLLIDEFLTTGRPISWVVMQRDNRKKLTGMTVVLTNLGEDNKCGLIVQSDDQGLVTKQRMFC
ncbi:hypothetical protein [Kaistia granuli]|uniref:hypothetical protein n=1 Tax=Kaistia granuli TaxID=363259 RepID=UPI0003724AA6|nr:hypothetical protein [Kaistia granuli]